MDHHPQAELGGKYVYVRFSPGPPPTNNNLAMFSIETESLEAGWVVTSEEKTPVRIPSATRI